MRKLNWNPLFFIMIHNCEANWDACYLFSVSVGFEIPLFNDEDLSENVEWNINMFLSIKIEFHQNKNNLITFSTHRHLYRITITSNKTTADEKQTKNIKPKNRHFCWDGVRSWIYFYIYLRMCWFSICVSIFNINCSLEYCVLAILLRF